MRSSYFSGLALAFLSSLIPYGSTLAPSDMIRDADPGQSGYLGGDNNMDPSVVDSAQFGQLWKVAHNPQELVTKILLLLNSFSGIHGLRPLYPL